MRQTTDARVAHWFGVISDVLHDPLTDMPYSLIGDELHATFDIVAVTWQWRNPDGTADFEINPTDICPPAVRLELQRPGNIDRHPLVHWYDSSLDPSVQTSARVPPALVPGRDLDFTVEVLRPLGADEQLSIPYRLAGREHRAFVLARTGRDFADDDLDVARRLQPALVSLDRQARLLATFMRHDTREAMRAAELTGRELAVLRLLAEGHTAFGIARRLSMSPRTAQKHLENLYRKLDVHDRLTAVRLAEAHGLIEPATAAARSGQHGAPL